jgi:hypothetical protein
VGLIACCAIALPALTAGCGSDSDSTAVVDTAKTTEAEKEVESGPTKAVLHPVGASKASGTVLYVKKASGIGLLKVSLRALEPLPQGGQYVLWLLASRHSMVPLSTYPVESDGRLDEDVVANPVFLGSIEDGSKTHFLVTGTDSAAEHEKSLGGGDTPYDPPYIGKPVLRGTFTGPLAGSGESE